MSGMDHRCCTLAWAGVALAGLTGCAASQLSARTSSVLYASEVNADELLLGLEAALIDEGFQIDPRSAAPGTITTHPLVQSRSVNDPTGRSSRGGEPQRLIAVASVRQTGSGPSAYVKVSIQQPSTEAHRVVYSDAGRSDLPGDSSPFEREGALTKEQSTVWSTVGRDRAMERRILDRVRELLPVSRPAPAP